MFARIKKSGPYEYLQIVENRREGNKTRQRVIAHLGSVSELREKGQLEPLVRSLARFSEKALLVLSARGDARATGTRIGPSLIFGRLWEELGIRKAIHARLRDRKFGFDVERAVFLTVLHRLFVSGSDRSCEKWKENHRIEGSEDLSLHHLYRAMAFLGEEAEDQRDATPFSPRCVKDEIEEALFRRRRDLFTSLDMVFFDTTSLYFEGDGGETLGERGFSKDKRPDLNQMVVGAVLDDEGNPVCSEMWPGNAADVTTLLPVRDRLKERFYVGECCIVADRGMVSKENLARLEEENVPYILGVRMRKTKEVREEVLSRAGRYREVHREGAPKDPDPLQVKEVLVEDRRYIVCCNPKEARKDARDREMVLESLREKIKKAPGSLVGNSGFRKYLKVKRGNFFIDEDKVKEDARYDGKWVLRTNTDLPAETVALKYKQLLDVEQLFREMKSILETRPIYHQKDEAIRGHVFCSFLALLLKKELYNRLEKTGFLYEWLDIKQDLEALQEVTVEESSKKLAVRTECAGVCGKIFQATGVAIPPTIREI